MFKFAGAYGAVRIRSDSMTRLGLLSEGYTLIKEGKRD